MFSGQKRIGHFLREWIVSERVGERSSFTIEVSSFYFFSILFFQRQKSLELPGQVHWWWFEGLMSQLQAKLKKNHHRIEGEDEQRSLLMEVRGGYSEDAYLKVDKPARMLHLRLGFNFANKRNEEMKFPMVLVILHGYFALSFLWIRSSLFTQIDGNSQISNLDPPLVAMTLKKLQSSNIGRDYKQKP